MPTQLCCSSPWEEAYARFETPDQEIAKFMRRLRKLGLARCDKSLQVVELFCGRGNGLRALERLGFSKIEGVDLSASLIAQYSGPATCYVCDCRHLPFDDASRDIIVVQGGLHHLPELPADLELTLAEIRRVLRPGGFAVIVEPWLTPFLRFVHTLCRTRLARNAWSKLDDLAIMIEHERDTYERWLANPETIMRVFASSFAQSNVEIGGGKATWQLMARGQRAEL